MTSVETGESGNTGEKSHVIHDVIQQKKLTTRLWIGVGVASFLALFFFVFLVVYATTENTKNETQNTENETQSSSSDTCETEGCIAAAESILSSMDTSADPCEDFFQYACGGYKEKYEYELATSHSVNGFRQLDEYEGTVFLDGLLYPENSDFKSNSAVLKAQRFMTSCLNSTRNNEEIVESSLLQELVRMVNFTDAKNKSQKWTPNSSRKFQESLAWLGGRSWNYLFSLSALGEQQMYLRQNYKYWLRYFTSDWSLTLNETVVPLYQQLFGLDASQSNHLADDVLDFADKVYAFSTHDYSYFDSSTIRSYTRTTTDMALFGTSAVLNYTNVALKEFAAKNLTYINYLDPDVTTYKFFKKLITLVESTSPQTVQFYLFANVIVYGLNFGDKLLKYTDQSRSVDRMDYCIDVTKNLFPYVYGYILYGSLFSDEKHKQVSDMVDIVVNDGVKVLLNGNTFMDDTSRASTDDKISKLRTFVGSPPPVAEYDTVEKYYSTVAIKDVYMQNLEQVTNWSAVSQQLLFNGLVVNMTQNWPSIFSDPSGFPYWLTGINAFYVSTGNFFTIPVTISQAPFFSLDYPSGLNFGGMGAVIGHEMSHGYDPNGILFDGNGNYVSTSIWTSSTKEEYDNRVECLIDQYDNLEVDSGVYVNGSITKTENVADNSGNAASWLAWKSWRKKHTDKSLPGVNLTPEQLFFIGWARSWCEVTVDGYYDGWTNVHAPNIARVWGVVQNSKDFADAYKCKADTPMNPTSKCELWA